MNPLEFLRSKVDEHPWNFIDEVKKILGVMQVTGTESDEVASCTLKGRGSYLVRATGVKISLLCLRIVLVDPF